MLLFCVRQGRRFTLRLILQYVTLSKIFMTPRNHADPNGFAWALPQDFPNHQLAVCSSPFGPGNLNGPVFSCSIPCHVVWDSVFCFLFTVSGVPLIGTAYVGRVGALMGHIPPVSQGMSPAAFPLRGQGAWEFAGVEASAWQHILCFSHHLLCVSPKAYLRRPLKPFSQTSFWHFENLVGFQSSPFISRACPHCWFVCQACTFSWFSSLPRPVIRGYCNGNWQLGNIKGPTAWL